MSYQDKLFALAERDERIVVMTAENRAPIRELPSRLRDRFIDTGITEQTLVGMATGLALRGRIPVVHALAAFLTMRAFEFIRTDAGISGLPVKLVGTVPGVLSDGNGPTHQAIEDVSLMMSIPGMRVFCPADGQELVDGLEEFLFWDGPCYLRFNPRPPRFAHVSPFAWGKAEVVGNGTDVAILTYGTLATEACEAREILGRAGISSRLVNVRSLKPLDEEAIGKAVSSCLLTVSVEDHLLSGGLASAVAQVCFARGIRARSISIGFEDRWFQPGRLGAVLENEGLTGAGIAERTRRALLECGKEAL